MTLTSTLFSAVTGNGTLRYIAGSKVVEVLPHPSTGHVTTCFKIDHPGRCQSEHMHHNSTVRTPSAD